MATLIDCSLGEGALDVRTGLLAGLKFHIQIGWKSHKFKQADISKVVEIDSQAYRSAGGAAAGAIIGGALTGGIGLLAGAALGGRRRSSASYLVYFRDGNHVAFTETRKDVIKVLNHFAKRTQVSQALKTNKE